MAGKTLFFISESVSPSSLKMTNAAANGFAYTASGLRNASTAADAEAVTALEESETISFTSMHPRSRTATATTPGRTLGFSPTPPMTAEGPAPSGQDVPATPAPSSQLAGTSDVFQKRKPTLELRPSLLSRQLSSSRMVPSASAPAASVGGGLVRRRKLMADDIYIAGAAPAAAQQPAATQAPLDLPESLMRHVTAEKETMLSQLQRRIGGVAPNAAEPVPYFSYKPETSIAW